MKKKEERGKDAKEQICPPRLLGLVKRQSQDKVVLGGAPLGGRRWTPVDLTGVETAYQLCSSLGLAGLAGRTFLQYELFSLQKREGSPSMQGISIVKPLGLDWRFLLLRERWPDQAR